MISNIERYKKDFDALTARGHQLLLAIYKAFNREVLDAHLIKIHGDDAAKHAKTIPDFSVSYQAWYSEAKTLIKQLLPDRLSDFVRYYEKPKQRKNITAESYSIEDSLVGLSATSGPNRIVGPEAAGPLFQQQFAILLSVKARFESSLFDIAQLVQGDIFDSELDAAEELAKNKYPRAAGALAGVVLERHLARVCIDHAVKVSKKAPGISDYNEALKNANVVDLSQWRFIQHLGDIRNLCDHSKTVEPTASQVNDLIAGVSKTIKTLI